MADIKLVGKEKIPKKKYDTFIEFTNAAEDAEKIKGSIDTFYENFGASLLGAMLEEIKIRYPGREIDLENLVAGDPEGFRTIVRNYQPDHVTQLAIKIEDSIRQTENADYDTKYAAIGSVYNINGGLFDYAKKGKSVFQRE